MSGSIEEFRLCELIAQVVYKTIKIAYHIVRDSHIFLEERHDFQVRMQVQIKRLEDVENLLSNRAISQDIQPRDRHTYFNVMRKLHRLLFDYLLASEPQTLAAKQFVQEVSVEELFRQIESSDPTLANPSPAQEKFWFRAKEKVVWVVYKKEKLEKLVVGVEAWGDCLATLISTTVPLIFIRKQFSAQEIWRNTPGHVLGDMNLKSQILTDQAEKEEKLPSHAGKREAKCDWTTGGMWDIRHVELISRGGYGEVHKMKNWRTGEHFARKLVQLFGDITTDDIENEKKAIEAHCGPDTSRYIVQVVKHGWLPQRDSCYFIDMELCSETVDEHIRKAMESSMPPLVHLDDTLNTIVEMRAYESVIQIGCDIASGLSFLHERGVVHRDLKPRNVLFSKADRCWKIADFGISSAATSQNLNTTRFARGTSSYRAPELLREVGRFNNKSDVWALGCVIYEVATHKKAFPSDWGVIEYSISSILKLPLPWPEWTEFRGDGERLSIEYDFETYFPQLRAQLLAMFSLDPSMRPTTDALSQSWREALKIGREKRLQEKLI